jgi:hypothetical protein
MKKCGKIHYGTIKVQALIHYKTNRPFSGKLEGNSWLLRILRELSMDHNLPAGDLAQPGSLHGPVYTGEGTFDLDRNSL